MGGAHHLRTTGSAAFPHPPARTPDEGARTRYRRVPLAGVGTAAPVRAADGRAVAVAEFCAADGPRVKVGTPEGRAVGTGAVLGAEVRPPLPPPPEPAEALPPEPRSAGPGDAEGVGSAGGLLTGDGGASGTTGDTGASGAADRSGSTKRAPTSAPKGHER